MGATADLPVGERTHAPRGGGLGTAVARGQPMHKRERPRLSVSFWSLLVVVLASGGSIGCATPGPLVTLTPAQAGVVWVAGRAVVSKEETGVRVATAFEHQDGATLALR